MARDESVEFDEPVARDDTAARMIEMSNRLFPRLTPIYAAVGLLMLASTPFYGWWVIVPVIVESIKTNISHRLVERGADPVRVLLADEYSSVVFVGTSIFFAGGVSSPFFPFLVIFAVIFPALFSGRHLRQSFTLLVVVVLLAALGPAKPAEYEAFFRLGTILCVLLTLRIFAVEQMSSDLHYRAVSLVDGLTGLANRRSFEAELSALIERMEDQPVSAALVVGDIDHFKRVNDTYGHDVGDQVLKDIADELRAAFRSEDTAFRIGGEEFALIAVGVSAELAKGMAESIRDRVAVSVPGGLQVSMSFGVSMHEPGESTTTWFRRSDAALFEAKRAGRNRVEFAKPLG